ncbi:MAG: hypothetical protein A2W00_09520 [Candidatus Eisenbacteria bacterium RBG_16_71_46]|nr:MAG: hypothetical protein A2W00_09520 [Candidatus Eisenbacteria bacterium RBG_16_71_46]
MIQRAFLLVTGPAGAGKTTLIEHLLRPELRTVIVARCIRDDALRKPEEATPRNHRELRRYRRAGAASAVEYRFPASHADFDAFYSTRFMEEYSEGVVLEGDRPVEHLDLTVFVTPVLAGQASLFRRVTVDRTRERLKILGHWEGLLESPQGTMELVRSHLGETLAEHMCAPSRLEETRASMLAILQSERAVAAPDPVKRWTIAPGYEGIEHAGAVVANIRSVRERRGAERLVEELARLRKNEAIFQDILGWRGHRIPITAVVANLADPRDPGLKKALARIARSFRRE